MGMTAIVEVVANDKPAPNAFLGMFGTDLRRAFFARALGCPIALVTLFRVKLARNHYDFAALGGVGGLLLGEIGLSTLV